MRLYVEAAGRTVPLDVGRRTDAASVLRKLRRRRIPCERLAVRGRPWQTQETVHHLNLQHNATVQGLGRLKGGCLEHQLKLYMRYCKRRLTLLTPSTRLVSVREGAGWSFFRFRG